MDTIMQKPLDQLETMKQSLAKVENTYNSINESRQNLLQQATAELPYRHFVITDTLISDLDKDTVLILDMFQMIQENMTTTMDICKKIIQDHPTP